MRTRNPAIIAWAIAALACGIWATAKTPVEWSPTVELPEATISAAWPNATARSVEQYVAAPIERALQSVDGVEGVESVSREGSASVIVRLTGGPSAARTTADILDQLAALRQALPEQASVDLTRSAPEELGPQSSLATIRLSGEASPALLREQAETTLASALRALPGVAAVEVSGGDTEEIQVRLFTGRAAALGVTSASVAASFQRAFTDVDLGAVPSGDTRTPVASAKPSSLAGVRALLVSTRANSTVALSDIADVSIAPAFPRSIDRVGGRPAVLVQVERAAGAPLLPTARRVRDALQPIQSALPEGLALELTSDASADASDELQDLWIRSGAGLLIVLVVLWVMLGRVRTVCVVALSAGIALTLGIATLHPLGLSLNALTLAGLALVAGLVVDNAVVVTEEVAQHPGLPAGAARRAVVVPLLGGTLTTVAATIPLVYLSGDLRSLFLPLGAFVAATLVLSLVAALFVVPAALPPSAPSKFRRPWSLTESLTSLAARRPGWCALSLGLALGLPLAALPITVDVSVEASRPVQRLAVLYNRSIGKALGTDVVQRISPYLGGVLGAFAEHVSIGDGWSFGEPRQTVVRLTFPPGIPLHQADAVLRRVESVVPDLPGVSPPVTSFADQIGVITIDFSENVHPDLPFAIRDRLISAVSGLGGVDVRVSGLTPEIYTTSSGGGVSGVRAVAYGPRYEDLDSLAAQFASYVEQRSDRVAAVNPNAGRYTSAVSRELVTIRWTPEAELRSGVQAAELAEALLHEIDSSGPTLKIDLQETSFPVRIFGATGRSADLDGLSVASLPITDSTSVRLARNAPPQRTKSPPSIMRENQRYAKYILVDYRGPLVSADTFLTRASSDFTVPAGYSVGPLDRDAFSDDAPLLGLILTVAACALTFLVTSSALESWKASFLVLLSLPIGGGGIAMAFLVSGADFSRGALVGATLSVGLVVNDAILLVERYMRHRRSHSARSPVLLMRLANRQRATAMWTTTLSSIGSMIPLLVFNSDDVFWTGLALTVTSGLLASTLLAPPAIMAAVALSRSVAR